MKVLLITSNYRHSWAFLPELREALLRSGVRVHVLDITNIELINEFGEIISWPFWASFNKIRGGHRLVRIILKLFIIKHLGNYDAVNIHYIQDICVYIIDDLIERSRNISLSIWGSDFYRASDNKLNSYRPLFSKLTYIAFGNVYTMKDFGKRVPGFEDKFKIASFGISKFQTLNQKLQFREMIKRELDIPTDKITVVCGYNAHPAQRHQLLLEQINKLPKTIKERIFLIFPLTYGGNSEYITGVIKSAKETQVEFRSFQSFLSDDEIARIRVSGDIVLNAQISDSFSASLQEHLLCNAILLAGDWLPYQIMTDLGVKYFPTPLNQFGDALKTVIENYTSFQNLVRENNSKLYNEGIWENRVKGWIDLYSAKYD